MKRNYNVPGFLKSLISAFCLVLITGTTAFANNAPGPLAVVSVLSLVILIVVLTFVGGGYRILKRINEAKYPSKTKRTIRNLVEFIAGVILFFVGVMTTVLGVVGFSLYAIARGIKMILWARDTGKEGERAPHLEGANPKKLRAAGIMLILLTVLILGYSILNLDDVTGVSPYRNKGHAQVLNDNARNAHSAAMAYLKSNPKARAVTCANMEEAGYSPTYKTQVSCFSNMTASSGEIRITGPESWGLKKPVAIITYSGELIRAEP